MFVPFLLRYTLYRRGNSDSDTVSVRLEIFDSGSISSRPLFAISPFKIRNPIENSRPKNAVEPFLSNKGKMMIDRSWLIARSSAVPPSRPRDLNWRDSRESKSRQKNREITQSTGTPTNNPRVPATCATSRRYARRKRNLAFGFPSPIRARRIEIITNVPI